MGIILEEKNEISNGNEKEIEKLIKLMIDICFSKINNLDDEKISHFHSGLMKLLESQRRKGQTERNYIKN